MAKGGGARMSPKIYSTIGGMAGLLAVCYLASIHALVDGETTASLAAVMAVFLGAHVTAIGRSNNSSDAPVNITTTNNEHHEQTGGESE